jgi:hypothetical protein
MAEIYGDSSEPENDSEYYTYSAITLVAQIHEILQPIETRIASCD